MDGSATREPLSSDIREKCEQIRNNKFQEKHFRLVYHSGAEGARYISQCLATNTTVTSLNLEKNEIGAEGALYLSQCLAINTTLRSLDLRENALGFEGVRHLVRAGSLLQSLDISDNGIGTEGMKALGSYLANNATLNSLDLGGNHIGLEGVRFLTQALVCNTTLTSINLRDNLIGPDAAPLLRDCIATSLSLSFVNLRSNRLGPEGARLLSQAIGVNRSLTMLDITSNGIGDRGFMAIQRAAIDNPVIRRIDVAYKNDITSPNPTIASLEERQLRHACITGDRLHAIELLQQHANSVASLRDLPESATFRVPNATVQLGAEAVRQWINDARQATKRIKLLVLGHERAGKTTLLRTMRSMLDTTGTGTGAGAGATALGSSTSGSPVHTPSPQSWNSSPLSSSASPSRRQLLDTESTLGIDIEGSQWMSKLDSEIRFKVYDFAGQVEYHATHQHFLSSSNAIYLIAVDVSQSADERDRQLAHWLDFVITSLPFATSSASTTTTSHKQNMFVIILGTQSDKLANAVNIQECRLQLERIASLWTASSGLADSLTTTSSIRISTTTTTTTTAMLSTQASSLSTSRLQQYLQHLDVTATSLMVSSATKSGIRELMQSIVKLSRTLLANERVTMVPHEYASAERLLDRQDPDALALKCANALIRTDELMAIASSSAIVATDSPVLPSSPAHLSSSSRATTAAVAFHTSRAFRIPSFNLSMAEWLHNIGAIVMSPSRSLICIEPQILARLMGLFVCSRAHHHRIQQLQHFQVQSQPRTPQSEEHDLPSLSLSSSSGSSSSFSSSPSCIGGLPSNASTDLEDDDRAIVTQQECELRIRTMLDQSGYHAVPTSIALEALMDWQVCFRIEDSDGRDTCRFIFPCMMPVCDTFAMPPLQEDDTASTSSSSSSSSSPEPPCNTEARRRLRSAKISPISQQQFNRLQVMMCELLDERYRMYANGMMLVHRPMTKPRSTSASPPTVSCSSRCLLRGSNSNTIELDQHQHQTTGMAVYRPTTATLWIITRGVSCGEMLDSILEHQIREHQGKWLREILDIEEYDHEQTTRKTTQHASAVAWDWMAGPSFGPSEAESNYWRRFTRSDLAELVDELQLKFPSNRPVTHLAAAAPATKSSCPAPVDEGKLFISELTRNETEDSRKLEFERVSRLFHKFVVGHKYGATFTLDRIVALYNEELEARFEQKYHEIQARRCQNPGEPPAWNELQQHILDVHARSLGRVIGSEQANLVLAWRGKDEASLYQCAIEGVYKYPPLTKEEEDRARKGLDDYGFFGRGPYFSQFFGYGAEYASKWRGAPLLLSWIIMGNVYPVTENCSKLPYDESLHGKPCKPGFDSHYVLVYRSSKQPIESTADKPDADEIVTFDPSQVLPRYLVYYKESIPSIDARKPALLWVDPCEMLTSQIEQRSLMDWINDNKHVQVRAATNTAEALHWIEQNAAPLEELTARGHFRIITNRSRAEDGGKFAALNLARHIRECDRWKKVPIMVYCKNALEVYGMHDRGILVFVSTQPHHVRAFGGMDAINDDSDFAKPLSTPTHCPTCNHKFRWLVHTQVWCEECKKLSCSTCLTKNRQGKRVCGDCLSDQSLMAPN